MVSTLPSDRHQASVLDAEGKEKPATSRREKSTPQFPSANSAGSHSAGDRDTRDHGTRSLLSGAHSPVQASVSLAGPRIRICPQLLQLCPC